jgi:branched-chain amino acid aminotransferase
MKVWLDGELVPQEDAKISVFDHGLLYGDGVFEGIRFYSRRIFRLGAHIRRLFDSAHAILMDLPWSEDEVIDFVRDTVRANDLDDGYIRLVVTRGVGGLGLSPDLCAKPSMFIIVSTVKLYPEENYVSGMNLATCATRRPTPAALMPQVKSLNYLNNVMAKAEAQRAGALEGVMLNEQGYIAECTGDNLFVVRDGGLVTPPVADGALDGITRRVILELAADLGIPAAERSMTRYDVFTADECFLTGSAAEVIPATRLDGRRIGRDCPGPVTAKLMAAFREEVTSGGTAVD